MRHSVVVLGIFLVAGGFAEGRELTFEDRLRAQEAIERVYHSHRIDAPASFEDAVPRELVSRKVESYLRKSAALRQRWNTPVTAEALRRELERIARETRFPDRLAQIYQALDHDPVLIQECFARPVLVDRLARNFYAFDGELHAVSRNEILEIAERLRAGQLDPQSQHPRRSMVSGKVEDGGSVREERERFLLTVALGTEEHVEYSVPKRSWDAWWSRAQRTFVSRTDSTDALPLSLPQPVVEAAGAACQPDDTWNNSSLDDFPDGRSGNVAVWTGTEMLIWGGSWPNGARYDPLLDVWTRTSSVGSPTALGPGVWTGTEMVIWGGNAAHTGGRYDPATDTWQPVSEVGAPTKSLGLSIVWSGTEMIVWGGVAGGAGRYDPATDSWASVSSAGAPSPRRRHTAVWTGVEMIVWGGIEVDSSTPFDDGGRYDPATDAWSSMSTTGLTSPWQNHAAVWTGSEMLIWSGLHHGARYQPATDVWIPVSTVNAPSIRYDNSTTWTGSELIVWSGYEDASSSYVDDGGRYDVATDTWSPISTTGAPTPREQHSTIWTGTHMILWGGRQSNGEWNMDSGARYDPAADQWMPVAENPAPKGRSDHAAAWTGNLMVIWGGDDTTTPTAGGRYDPLTDAWTPTALLGAPGARRNPWTFWTGRHVLIYAGDYHDTSGGRYDPVTDTWLGMTPMPGFSSYAITPAATWTGKRMAVLGLSNTVFEDVGGFYDPESDSWEALSFAGAPSNFRLRGTITWTGSRLIHWGGSNGSDVADAGTGHIYDPATASWSPISQENTPEPRVDQYAVWTGSGMLIWGGFNHAQPLISGGLYDPLLDAWTSVSTQGVSATESSFQRGTGLWTGRHFIVWGGGGSNAGYVYDPVADTWTPTSLDGAPAGRSRHTSVWTGGEMIVWGGNALRTGGRYALDQMADVDGDGLTFCAGDCNDLDPFTFPGALEICDGRDNDCDGVIPALELVDLDFDNASACNDCDDMDGTRSPGIAEFCNGVDSDCNGSVDDADADGDGFFCAEDCAPFDSSVFPGAVEANDGQDNQCPGETGHGAIDEVSGETGFPDPAEPDRFCWAAQQGAGSYQVARSSDPEFPGSCFLETVTGACLDDPELPGLGEVFFYLVRSTQPILGSWGAVTALERAVVCGAESSCSNGIDDDGNGVVDCGDAGCLGRPGCDLAIYSFTDTFGDDVSSVSLYDFFLAAQTLPGDYLYFSVGGAALPSFEWCSERADFYRDQYVALAPGGGSAFSGSWDRWVQTAGMGWTGPINSPYENLYGTGCELEYYWCSEIGLDGHLAGVAPGETGICEAFDNVTCGDGTASLSIFIARDRQTACGF